MLTGSCLCGAIHYEITGPLSEMGHCHCTMCQKAHGAAFGTYAKVKWDDFRLVRGEDQLRQYQSSASITRTFCQTCGANLQFIRAGKSHFGLAVGTLDMDSGVKPTYQIWTGSKAHWWDLQEGLLSHETQPGRS